jgi:CheY-specific phosphatase CheX
MNPELIQQRMPMTSTVDTFNVRPFVIETLVSVFDTMLASKAEPVTELPPRPSGVPIERVTGCVGLGGEGVGGALYIHLPAPLARKLAAAMLGSAASEQTTDAEVNDVVGELCNMVTGQLKSRLCDHGTACALSTPAIIRGDSYEILGQPDTYKEELMFTCHGEPVVVEVHLKFK